MSQISIKHSCAVKVTADELKEKLTSSKTLSLLLSTSKKVKQNVPTDITQTHR